MSKLVKPTEVGKAFAFFGLFQAFVPMVAGPIVGVIYRETSKARQCQP
jgi:MFS-type transporter involved in bile tolerance (Atg22 family)